MATTSPSKEATPATSDAKASDKPIFTEKEERVLKVAWHCLKTGVPEIDFVKLTKLGEFNTQKTATNTWGTIKKKLRTLMPEEGEGEDEAGAETPKKGAKATPQSKKRGKKADADDEEAAADGEVATPTKKPRKTPAKKGKKVTAGADEAAGEEGVDVKMDGADDDITATPTKKPRKSPAKKGKAAAVVAAADEETAEVTAKVDAMEVKKEGEEEGGDASMFGGA
ncbi:hypothetical protein BAUCODRAFT_433478 [Baudoinia panamericana UAMH 10762]|uniref:Myb-like domain-containing protein n=1 Tax=Baudoinia panamericana (strain UAMH 10762) TaxID=717646 RepID=M2NCN1_BAUPA|nr:uncharacterized protein BAUCODRAFT_433478 [Baudoinia panamericana UAMH 10762]EMC96939.1 hypothetical protein BAUCODRAFT_433478 [Baudoinia panamericana UAMH 10762]